MIEKRERSGPPAWIKVAAWIWLLLAGLMVLSTLFRPVAGPGATAIVLAVGLVFAGIFGFVGWQTLTGRARDTLGNGVGSVCLGAYSFLTAYEKAAGGASPEQAGAMMPSFAMLAAGVLALAGRQRYKAWRATQQAR